MTLALILGALGTATYLLSSPLLSLSTIKLLLSASIPLSLSSKLPQIISNFQLGSTGQLSAFLVFNSLAGCLARVYTTSTETGDNVLWWGFALGALLNGVIGAQMIASWNQESGAGERVKEKVEEVEEQLEKVEVHPEAVRQAETPVKKVQQQGASPKVSRTSSPASAKRYVRKLE
jgi:mannose-P-dolichol utilization defect 1